MSAVNRFRFPLAIAVGLFAFTCLLSSASAEGSAGNSYAQAVAASHPVGWWRLGETTGGYADNSGHTPAHTGTLQRTPRSTFTRGESDCPIADGDGCIKMTAPPQDWPMFATSPDQSSVYVSANYADSTFNFGGLAPFSLETWINPLQGSPGCPAILPDCTVSLGILGSFTMDLSGGINVGYGLYYSSPDDKIVFSRRGWSMTPEGHSYADGTSISTLQSPGGWAYVVATYDGTTMRLYVNGVERTSVASSLRVDQPYHSVEIGKFPFDFGVTEYNGFFYGGIDEPAIYDRALSEDEILAHYRGGVGLPPEGDKLVIDVVIPPDAKGQVPAKPEEGEPYRPWQGDEVTALVSGDPKSALPPSTTVKLHYEKKDAVVQEDDLTAVTDSNGTASFTLKVNDETTYDLTASAPSLTDVADATAQIEPKRLPMVYLPGITGSYLGLGDFEVWPSVHELIADPDDDSLDLLKMDALGDSLAPISVMKNSGYDGVIGELSIVPGYSIPEYKPAMELLSRKGYQYQPYTSGDAGQTLFPLALDWRQPASRNASLLSGQIRLVGIQTGAPRVTVVAHSQGGLVLRSALEDSDTASSIFRAVTLGTPYLGAPKFMTVLKFTWPCQVKKSFLCILDQGRAREISLNFPGANELLPSAAYVSNARMSPVYIDPNLSDWPGVPGTGFLDASQYQNFMGWTVDGLYDEDLHENHKLFPSNSHLVSQALGWHSGIDGQDTGKVLRIIGSGSSTIGGVTLWSETDKECSGTWPFETCTDGRHIDAAPMWVDGDGTVPFTSAVGLARDGLVLVNAGASHMGLAQDVSLAEAVGYLRFDGNPLYPPSTSKSMKSVAKLDAEPSDFGGTELQVLGNAKGRIRDSQGRMLGALLSGDPEDAEMFDPDAFVDTGSVLSYFLHDSGDYEGKWISLGEGDIVLRENANENGTITSSKTSLPFHVAKDATFSLSLPISAELNASTIDIDDDSDGVVDRTVPFSEPISGDSLNDRTGPTVAIDVKHLRIKAGHVARVTVTAEDGGSGVAGIEYRIPATGAKGTYSAPLTLPEQGEIFVRAVDKAGNWSVEQMATLDDQPGFANLVEKFRSANFSVAGHIGYDGDVDLWGLKAKDGRYRISLGQPHRVDYDLRVFSESGELVATSSRHGRQSERISVKLEAGKYYLAVNAKAGQFDERTPYRLSVKAKHHTRKCVSYKAFFSAHRCSPR